MDHKFKRGELVKCTQSNAVYKVCGFTKDHPIMPDGWVIVSEIGELANPKFLERYEGATSCMQKDKC